jgi:membrane protease subunit HflK
MSNGNNQGPWGNTPNQPPPDFDKALKKGQEKLKEFMGGNGDNKRGLVTVMVAIFVIWLISGLFIVDAKEQGVILRFGAFDRTVSPGLNYRLPFPIESNILLPVTSVNRVEIGLRSASGRGGNVREVTKESLMLTGDENIVDINFEVQWKIGDVREYLFNVRDPRDTVKNVAESAMREVIGRTAIASALAEGKFVIQQETKKLLQETLNNYKAGIEIVELQMRKVDPPAMVIDAFRDVQTARADKERAQNEAETYRNDIIPRARGQAEQTIQEAEAYKQEVTALAEGKASRFVAIYNKYKNAKYVTRKRMYLETMEEVMGGMDKIMIDTRAQGSGVLPYLPLETLKNRGQ